MDEGSLHFLRSDASVREAMHEIEDMNVGDKHWTMTGEVTGRQRPLNSLLDADLDFQSVVKTRPVVTEEQTVAVLDTIKSRIAQGVFDDVVRVESSEIDKPSSTNKLPEVSSSKSTKSLSSIYEQDYLTNLGLEEKQTDQRKEKIRAKMHSLFQRLDSLTSFTYSAKVKLDLDVKPVPDAPALQIEEKVPMIGTGLSRRTPEEIDKKEGDLKSKEEVTSEEKMRHRRRNKERKRKADASTTSATKRRKKDIEETASFAKQLRNDSRKNRGSNISSTKFFQSMEDERKSKGKAQNGKRKTKIGKGSSRDGGDAGEPPTRSVKF